MPESRNKPDSGLDEAASRAFDGAPRPDGGAVRHADLAGDDPELDDPELDDPGLVQGSEREPESAHFVDLDTIEHIYREQFLEKRLSQGMTDIGAELDTGLSDALAALRDGVGSSRRYLDALSAVQDRLSGLTRQEATRAAGVLLELARAHTSQAERLNGALLKVRAQMRELRDELRRLRDGAYLDHLTQLPNRRRMDEVMAREMALARSTGAPLSFALSDLDDFKRLNDVYGHAIGDAVLKHVAVLLRRNLKGQDTPARFGGEEFAIVFPGTAPVNAGQVLDKIRRRLVGTTFVLGGARGPIGRVSTSFGVTQVRPGDSAAEVIRRADALLYRAKERGRNRVETDEP